MMYGAYDLSRRSHYADEDGNSISDEKFERLLDTDANVDALRARVNAYFAKPDVVSFHRGIKHEIPEGALRSEVKFSCGGGCDVYRHIAICELPTLKS